MRSQTTQNVEAMIAPVHCPVCGLTNREASRVLAGLWIYISREKLLYVQRYGVFESATGRMVAWGTLLTPPLASNVVGDMNVDSALPLGLAETS